MRYNHKSKENLLHRNEVDEINHQMKYIRDFNTNKPNEGKLYLSLLLDILAKSSYNQTEK